MILLLACTSSQVSIGGENDRPRRDTDVHDETAAPVDTAIEDIGDNPGSPEPAVVLDPPGGTFVDTVQVTLTLGDGEEAHFTLDDSLPDPARDEAWKNPLTLRGSAELRVVVTGAGGDLVHGGATYVKLDADAADFDSNLPLVVLWSEGSLPDSDGDDYVSIGLQVHDVGDDGRAALLGDGATVVRAGLRIRGSSTAGDPKHSYALELRNPEDDEDDDEPLLDMPADSDWVLYAPLGFDRAFMRNALMYQLSNDMGRYAPRTRFVEVFEAGRGGSVGLGDYVGVYVLMERVKRSEDRVAVTQITAKDTSPPEVTGGYVFKRDRAGGDEDGFWAGDAGGAFEFSEPLVYVYPREETIEREQAAYLADAVDAFADALAAPDGISPDDGRHWSEHIDMDAWIDHHVLNMFAKNPDALRLSGYMHKDREGPIVAGPIWDFDRALYADDDTRADDPTWWDNTNETWDTTPMFTYGWYEGLFADEDFATAYWARWRVVLEDTLSVAHVEGVIDEMAAELAEAAPRNYARWSAYGPRGGSLDSEVALLKEWIETRHAWIAACLVSHADAPETCEGG